MNDNTCCDCAFLIDGYCSYHQKEIGIIEPVCEEFVLMPEQKPTNGDVIRKGNYRKLAEIFDDLYNGNKCKYCIHHAGSGSCKLNPTPYSEYDEGYLDDEDCLNGFESWLNAPAESEEKNQRKWGYHHYRVKGMKLKEVEK
jgi:hypothetical protein